MWTKSVSKIRGTVMYENDFGVALMTGHLFHPGFWAFSCHKLGFDGKGLNIPDTEPVEKAWAKAEKILTEHMENLNTAFTMMKNDGPPNTY